MFSNMYAVFIICLYKVNIYHFTFHKCSDELYAFEKSQKERKKERNNKHDRAATSERDKVTVWITNVE